jgi:hypothetical protein
VTGVEVHGRDVARGAYRVSVAGPDGPIHGLVPETLIGAPALPGMPRHQHAYEWLARNRARIERALCARQAGRPVRPPFDRVEIAGGAR